MSETVFWIWLVVGFIPYRVERGPLPHGGRRLQVKALFWTLEVRWRKYGRHSWVVRVPLIERLRDAVWAAVTRLRGRTPPQT